MRLCVLTCACLVGAASAAASLEAGGRLLSPEPRRTPGGRHTAANRERRDAFCGRASFHARLPHQAQGGSVVLDTSEEATVSWETAGPGQVTIDLLSPERAMVSEGLLSARVAGGRREQAVVLPDVWRLAGAAADDVYHGILSWRFTADVGGTYHSCADVALAAPQKVFRVAAPSAGEGAQEETHAFSGVLRGAVQLDAASLRGWLARSGGAATVLLSVSPVVESGGGGEGELFSARVTLLGAGGGAKVWSAEGSAHALGTALDVRKLLAAAAGGRRRLQVHAECDGRCVATLRTDFLDTLTAPHKADLTVTSSLEWQAQKQQGPAVPAQCLLWKMPVGGKWEVAEGSTVLATGVADATGRGRHCVGPAAGPATPSDATQKRVLRVRCSQVGGRSGGDSGAPLLVPYAPFYVAPGGAGASRAASAQQTTPSVALKNAVATTLSLVAGKPRVFHYDHTQLPASDAAAKWLVKSVFLQWMVAVKGGGGSVNVTAWAPPPGVASATRCPSHDEIVAKRREEDAAEEAAAATPTPPVARYTRLLSGDSVGMNVPFGDYKERFLTAGRYCITVSSVSDASVSLWANTGGEASVQPGGKGAIGHAGIEAVTQQRAQAGDTLGVTFWGARSALGSGYVAYDVYAVPIYPGLAEPETVTSATMLNDMKGFKIHTQETDLNPYRKRVVLNISSELVPEVNAEACVAYQLVVAARIGGRADGPVATYVPHYINKECLSYTPPVEDDSGFPKWVLILILALVAALFLATALYVFCGSPCAKTRHQAAKKRSFRKVKSFRYEAKPPSESRETLAQTSSRTMADRSETGLGGPKPSFKFPARTDSVDIPVDHLGDTRSTVAFDEQPRKEREEPAKAEDSPDNRETRGRPPPVSLSNSTSVCPLHSLVVSAHPTAAMRTRASLNDTAKTTGTEPTSVCDYFALRVYVSNLSPHLPPGGNCRCAEQQPWSARRILLGQQRKPYC